MSADKDIEAARQDAIRERLKKVFGEAIEEANGDKDKAALYFYAKCAADENAKKYVFQYFLNDVIAARPDLMHDPYAMVEEATRRLKALDRKRRRSSAAPKPKGRK